MLSLRSCSAGYGEGTVLRDVSLDVAEGEVVAILGANGAGKSTLLRSIIGAVPDLSGSLSVNGSDFSRRTPEGCLKRGIAHVPEGRGIFPGLSVEDNLRLGIPSRASRRSEMSRVLERFPVLEERARQKAGTLSGGEQQMLAVGRGLVGRPAFLLIDEPSLGLAPRLVSGLFETLRAISTEEGVGVAVAEQSHAVCTWSDAVTVLSQGRAVKHDASSAMSGDELFKLYVAGSDPQ